MRLGLAIAAYLAALLWMASGVTVADVAAWVEENEETFLPLAWSAFGLAFAGFGIALLVGGRK